MSATGLQPDPSQRGVDVGHRQRRLDRRWRRLPQARPAHSDLPLAQLAGQVGGTRLDLVRRQAAQRRRQEVDLAPARGDRRDGGGGGREVQEPHGQILAATTDNLARGRRRLD